MPAEVGPAVDLAEMPVVHVELLRCAVRDPLLPPSLEDRGSVDGAAVEPQFDPLSCP